MGHSVSIQAAALAAFAANSVLGDSKFSLDSTDDVKQTARTISSDVLRYYHGNETGGIPGILPGPPPTGDYYWWNGAAMWSSLIEYWHYTGDAAYNDVTMQGLLHQVGEMNDYMPANFTASMTNDDQGVWAFAAMLAAERTFPNPPADQPQWLQLAENVFANLVDRAKHDSTCDGGLRWAVFPFNKGYNYVNAISNGVLFGLGSRLARYTGNKTYADWAEKTWEWMEDANLVNNKTYAIYDGVQATANCKDINKYEFSYNNAIFALGAAHLYNHTAGDQKWKARLDKLLEHGLDTFFPNGVATEAACEPVDRCNIDMYMMKGLLHQWYAQAVQVAPYAAEKVLPILEKSAKAAVSTCTGGDSSRQCGSEWSTGKYGGTTGANQELSVLNAVFSYLVDGSKAPVTATTGGKSTGGGGSQGTSDSDDDGDSDKDSSDKNGSDKDSSDKDGSGKTADKDDNKGGAKPNSLGTRDSAPMLMTALTVFLPALVVGLL